MRTATFFATFFLAFAAIEMGAASGATGRVTTASADGLADGSMKPLAALCTHALWLGMHSESWWQGRRAAGNGRLTRQSTEPALASWRKKQEFHKLR